MKRTVTSLLGRQQAEIPNLSLLRDHLEEELGKMRSRCWELEREVTGHHLIFALWKRKEAEWIEANLRLETERNEARQWARKLYRDVRKWRTDAWEHEERKSSVLSQLLNIEAENADLRSQLAEARNKALDEAVITARNIVWSRLATSYNRTQVIDALVVGLIALKDAL